MSRKDTEELATVIHVHEEGVKVKWDDGSTSYYRPDTRANVMLKEPKE